MMRSFRTSDIWLRRRLDRLDDNDCNRIGSTPPEVRIRQGQPNPSPPWALRIHTVGEMSAVDPFDSDHGEQTWSSTRAWVLLLPR